MDKAPIATTTTGLRIANFSSAHTFSFTDGTWLEPCSPERCLALSLRPVEQGTPSYCGRWTDIRISFELSQPVIEALDALQADEGVDVILAPRVVLEAAEGLRNRWYKLRGVRMADRVRRVCHHDRFCI